MDPPEFDSTAEKSIAEKSVQVHQCTTDGITARTDRVVIEEPMEIRVVHGPEDGRTMRSLSVTMRTPGHDRELAAGFLFTESILESAAQIQEMELRGVGRDGHATGNIVRVHLQPDVTLDMQRLQRHFFTSSSCGVCGKASLESLSLQGLVPIAHRGIGIKPSVVRMLSAQLRASQQTFERTGGLHAAALFNADGELKAAREDVGRHNAVDKLIGSQFLDGVTQLNDTLMMVSGRVSFEIMQKALVARLPIIVAVGAPSSLAVDLALEYNMTLVGFASDRRFNVYAGSERIEGI